MRRVYRLSGPRRSHRRRHFDPGRDLYCGTMKNHRALRALPILALCAALPARALDRGDMDPTVQPCKDFFLYADGGWLKANPIPPAFSRWGSFTVLADRNREVLKSILEQAAAAKAPGGSDEQKIGDFYAACMDETTIEADGAKPIASELERIAKIADRAGLEAEVARLHENGVGALFG